MASSQTQLDARGVALTTGSVAAARAYDAALASLVAHRRDVPARLELLLGLDPQLVSAQVILGFGARLLSGRSHLNTACAALARARASAAERPVTRRESHLVDALAASIDGRTDRAIEALEAAVTIEPRDLLAIKLSHALSFMSGRSVEMRRNLERIEGAWSDPSLPGAGAVRGCLAFALLETGDLDRAETVGREACALEPNLWSIHALGHVHHTRGQAHAGSEWLASHHALIAEGSNLGLHLVWHQALFELMRGRNGEALELYDAHLARVLAPDYRDFVNAVSLLVRIELAGVPVGRRWDELTDVALRDGTGHGLGFAEVHYALALVVARRDVEARALCTRMADESAEAAGTDAAMRREVALPLARSLLGTSTHRAEVLRQIAPSLVRLGGSRVQRELFALLGGFELAGLGGDAVHARSTRLAEPPLLSRPSPPRA